MQPKPSLKPLSISNLDTAAKEYHFPNPIALVNSGYGFGTKYGSGCGSGDGYSKTKELVGLIILIP
jgi:hypothetical protein